MNKPERETPRGGETEHTPGSPLAQADPPSHGPCGGPGSRLETALSSSDYEPDLQAQARLERLRLTGAREASSTPPRRVFGGLIRLAAFFFMLFLARRSDLTLALYQGFLVADFTVWILALGFDAALRKTLSFLEGIGYLFLFWLFCQVGNGSWLPEDPTLLGMTFLSFLLFFLGKTLWWSHRNFGSE